MESRFLGPKPLSRESSETWSEVSFDPVPGDGTKYFVPYLCCHPQRGKFQGWLGKKGLLRGRSGVIHPAWAVPGLGSLKGGGHFSRVRFRLGKGWLLGIRREGRPQAFAAEKASRAFSRPVMEG